MTLKILAPEQAKNLILRGEALENCSIETIDLSALSLDKAITIASCTIREFKAEGTIFKERVTFIATHFGNANLQDDAGKMSHEKERKILAGSCSFKKAIFEKEAHFEKITFNCPASFSSVRFHANTFFINETKFLGDGNFLNVFFKNVGSFENVQFAGEVNFSDADFGEEIIFENAEFVGEAEFPEAAFKSAEFQHSIFHENVNFCSTDFEDWADFTGAIFKSHFDITGAKFHNGADFSEAEFHHAAIFENLTIQQECYFIETLFHQSADFDHSQFNSGADFRKSVFKDRAEFRAAHLSESLFNQCIFEKAVDFSACESGKMHFQNAVFYGPVDFKTARFSQAIHFYQAVFEDKVNFDQTEFAEAYFEHALFKDHVSFRKASFKKNTSFQSVNFQRKTDFTLAEFHGMICCSNMIADDVVLRWSQIKGRIKNHHEKNYKLAMEEYGLLKSLFEKQNEYDDMDEAYRMFRRTKRKTQKVLTIHPLKLIRKLFDFLILDLGSGYGTKPLNIAMTTLVIILLFGIFYSFFSNQLIIGGNDQGIEKNILFCTYYSFVTFVTLGAENLYPYYQGWLKYVVAVQAFLGFFMMTLFVATFTRKVIR